MGSTGILTIGSDATWNAGGNSVSIGLAGVGTMNVIGGGQFTTTGTVVVGDTTNGDGTVFVSGTNSTFTSTGLTIGNLGFGHATISNGASVKPQTVAIGNGAGSTGSLTVTGASSILDTSTHATYRRR